MHFLCRKRTRKQNTMIEYHVEFHQLNISSLMGNIKDPKLKPYTVQDKKKTENEFHFLVACISFENERVKILCYVTKITPTVATLNNECKFQWILSNKYKHVI